MEMVSLPKLMSMFPTFHSKIKPMTKKRYDNSVANKRMSLAEMFRTKGAGDKSRATKEITASFGRC